MDFLNFDNLVQRDTIPGLLGAAIPVVLIAMMILFVVLSMVLNYHWKRYAASPVLYRRLRFSYLAGGISIITFMIIVQAMYYI